MDRTRNSLSMSIESERGSSSGTQLQRKYASMESLHSSTASTNASQLSLASTSSDGGNEKKKKRLFGSFRKNKLSSSSESLPSETKKSKSKNPFKKKSKKTQDKNVEDENGPPMDSVVENASPEHNDSEVTKPKKKLSLVRSFKNTIRTCPPIGKFPDGGGPAAGSRITVSSSLPPNPNMVPHPVDLEEEPKRLQSSSKSGTATEEPVPDENLQIPERQDDNSYRSPDTAQTMSTTFEQNGSVMPEAGKSESEPVPINYGATAQRIRYKKPSLQRETLEKIFLQRVESESEAGASYGSSVGKHVDLNSPRIGSENGRNECNNSEMDPSVERAEEAEPGVEEFGSNRTQQWKGGPGSAEIGMVEEYIRASEPATVSINPDPESYNQFAKRLSIISEGDCEGGSLENIGIRRPSIFETDGGLPLERSTIRRASDFTDSFRKLEPFKFDLLPVFKGKRERLYKVLVVGELGTGKTSIIKRYVHQFFSQHYRATIGVDFALKVLRWDPETVVRLQLWDIAGQERFGSMTRVYYKEAVGAFVVFDVTRAATLEAVHKWKVDLDSKVVLPDGRAIPTVLLANKSDQPKEGLAANREKMNEFCQEEGFSAWFETSAKDNINIDESANFLVSKILEMDKWSQEPISADPDSGMRLGAGKPGNGSNSCAC